MADKKAFLLRLDPAVWSDLERLAALIAPCTDRWEEFLDAVQASAV